MNSVDADIEPSLLLVDDHTVVREGLKRILQTCVGDDEVHWRITEAGSGAQALAYLRGKPYRLAIVDLSMPGISGLDLVRRLRAEFPAVSVLVLSMHAEEQYALRSFGAGAHGYVTKDSAAAELVTAVQCVGDGGCYVTGSLAERVAQQLAHRHMLPRHAELAGHEVAVLARIVKGQRIARIASEMQVSAEAVESLRSSSFHLTLRAEAAADIRCAPDLLIADGEALAGLPFRR